MKIRVEVVATTTPGEEQGVVVVLAMTGHELREMAARLNAMASKPDQRQMARETVLGAFVVERIEEQLVQVPNPKTIIGVGKVQ